MGKIYNNIVETVGRTPLVKLNKVTAGLEATILLKCEFFNPLGRVKDRIGMAMIEDAEKRGILKKDTVCVFGSRIGGRPAPDPAGRWRARSCAGVARTASPSRRNARRSAPGETMVTSRRRAAA